jgi:hypothetical protein
MAILQRISQRRVLQRNANQSATIEPKMKTPASTSTKLLLVLSAVCCALTASFAQSVGNPIYEPFSDSSGGGGTSYTPGDPLGGQSQTLAPGFVSAGTFTGTTSIQSWWSRTNIASPTTWPTIVSGDLFYPGLPSAGGGRSVQFGGSGASALMNLTAGSTGFTPGNAPGTYYYSFLLQLTDLGTLSSGSSFFAGFTKVVSHNNGTATPTSVGARVYVQSDGGTGYRLGIALGSGDNNVTGPLAYDSTSFSAGDTLFVVGSYSINAGTGNDQSALWINPDVSTFGSATAPAADVSVSNGNSVLDMQRLASFTIFQNSVNQPTGLIDDLRIGLTWADVVPEPSTSALGMLGLAMFWARARARRQSN